ncbi:hypothetical protein EVG20_g8773 [Dentipellis fragilis]|uniref:Uncharacterized protein n=1 Tax=Dentipellis fragilis TaxID=205917 RepID=A0A4Y9Y4W6_9AGAM|nr:hypothetical protein EVG20_g8773 [Dentipellis fragilis]
MLSLSHTLLIPLLILLPTHAAPVPADVTLSVNPFASLDPTAPVTGIHFDLPQIVGTESFSPDQDVTIHIPATAPVAPLPTAPATITGLAEALSEAAKTASAVPTGA